MSVDVARELALAVPPTLLCVARLFPVSFLCPVFGGSAVPGSVRLSVVLSLALALHVGGGVGHGLELGPAELLIGVVRELLLGTAVGLVTSLPFDAARMGGRFVDLFRGSSAEAALPHAGTRECASGDFLYQLLVALFFAAGGLPLMLTSLWRSFGLLPLGVGATTEALAPYLARLVTGAMGTGLAIAAPVAGAALAVDLIVGCVARWVPTMSALQEVGTPARLLSGGAVLWLSLGLVSSRLLAPSANDLASLWEVLGG